MLLTNMQDLERLLNYERLKQDFVLSTEKKKYFLYHDIPLQDKNDKYYLYANTPISFSEIQDFIELFEKYHMINLTTCLYDNYVREFLKATGLRKVVCNYIENSVVKKDDLVLSIQYKLFDFDKIREYLNTRFPQIKETFLYSYDNEPVLNYNSDTYYLHENKNYSFYFKDFELSKVNDVKPLSHIFTSTDLNRTELRGIIEFKYENNEFKELIVTPIKYTY